MMWGFNTVSWFWMLPMMLVFWAVAVGVIVVLVRSLASPRFDRDAPMEALRRRLAAGQITRDEYEKTKQLLEG
jgi:uncharacterized membrane protein